MLIKTKETVINEFKDKMNVYRSFVCGYDVDDSARMCMYHQAIGVFYAYCGLFPQYTDELSDVWYDDYCRPMEKVIGYFYCDEKE